MIDEAYDETEEILKKLERRITEVYSQAAQECEDKMNEHLRKFAQKDKIKRQKLLAGEITQDEYKYWLTGQLAIGQRWEEMRDTLARDLLNTKHIAESMVTGYCYNVFALNHNYATFCVEHDSLVDTSYTLYNRDSVIRLIRDNPSLFPKYKNRDRKLIQQYNQMMQSAVLQGILQGESLQKIAKRMGSVYDTDRKATIRNARTAVTGAQNAGRHQANMRAESMGIKRVEVWRAIMDGRTRHSHRQLDGQIKDVSGYFHSELGDLRFPGDPQGVPADVYNCRCAIITKRPQAAQRYVEQLKDRRNPALEDMTYDEWRDAKQKDILKLTLKNKESKKP